MWVRSYIFSHRRSCSTCKSRIWSTASSVIKWPRCYRLGWLCWRFSKLCSWVMWSYLEAQDSSTEMFTIELLNIRSNFAFIMIFVILLRSIYSIHYNHRILYVFIVVACISNVIYYTYLQFNNIICCLLFSLINPPLHAVVIDKKLSPM